ncbi:MAG: dynamin family protein [Veillonella sp.]|nr:dynamin family protein [Veillonella sp.]
MEIVDILDRYIEVSDFLNDKINKQLLSSFKESAIHKDFLLPFMGQLSAGKSRLINNLLQRDLLPTKSVETTAFLTYIKYGERDNALAEYQDGTFEEIDLSKVKTLDQTTNAESINPIIKLTIYIKSELLQTGLTIVDTPGVNTLIQSHIELTEQLLEQSQYIVYVLGKAPEVPDMVMAKKIEQLNIPVIFVRTHLDCINLDEESYEDVETGEKNSIRDELEHDIRFFALSCKEELNTEKDWKERFIRFRSFLQVNFISAVEAIYTTALLKRLQVVKRTFEEAIDNKERLLSSSSDKAIEELQQRQKDLERTIVKLNDDLIRIQSKWQSSAQRIGQDIEGRVRTETHIVTCGFENKLKNFSFDSEVKKEAKDLYDSELYSSIVRLNQTAGTFLLDSLHEYDKEININTEAINADLQNCGIDLVCSFDLRDAAEYDNKIQDLQNESEDKICQLRALAELADSDLQELGLQREGLTKALNQVQQANLELNKLISDFNSNNGPKYISKQSTLGNVMSKVGSACDIAMLLMPAAGWAKAGEFLAAKGVSLAGRSGKLAQFGGKILTVASKGAMALAATDETKDMATLIGGAVDTLKENRDLICLDGNGLDDLMEKIREQKERIDSNMNEETHPHPDSNTSIFDCLSLSYWFGAVGELLDPSTYEIDMDYERERERKLQELQRQANIALREKIEMMKRMGTITDAESERKEIIKQKEIQQKSIEREYHKEFARLNKEKNERIRQLVIEQTANKFSETIESYASILIQRSKDELNKVINGVLESAKVKLNSDLMQMQTDMQHIIDVKQLESSNLEDMMSVLSEMRIRLKYEY